MREDSALERDFSTQKVLLSVLGRVEKVEAPRSFAISPAMVAAAERSESRLSRFAELFAPQRKLALAPAVIAGIAALSVALLTIGDVTGVVDQSGSVQNDSASTIAVSESSSNDSGGSSAPSLSFADDSSSAAAPAATAAMAAAGEVAPPSLAMEAPLAGTADEDDATSLKAVPELAVEEEVVEQLLPKSDEPAESSIENELAAGDGSMTSEASPELAYSAEVLPGTASPNNGLSLPLRQLQFALAALALAAIGAWAGLRRARGE